MEVSENNFPDLYKALKAVAMDNGWHLPGRLYPGERLDLSRIEIPVRYQHLVKAADAGLRHLRVYDIEAWEDFTIGDQVRAVDLCNARGNLDEAHTLLGAYFQHWPEACQHG